MLDKVRPKILIEEDSKVAINEYKNPYLAKLTIKVLPQYSEIKTLDLLLPPVRKPINFSVVQSLPLWRNEKLRIGFLWQQNLRNNYNRSHFGFFS